MGRLRLRARASPGTTLFARPRLRRGAWEILLAVAIFGGALSGGPAGPAALRPAGAARGGPAGFPATISNHSNEVRHGYRNAAAFRSRYRGDGGRRGATRRPATGCSSTAAAPTGGRR